jgi:hypothetical protein
MDLARRSIISIRPSARRRNSVFLAGRAHRTEFFLQVLDVAGIIEAGCEAVQDFADIFLFLAQFLLGLVEWRQD